MRMGAAQIFDPSKSSGSQRQYFQPAMDYTSYYGAVQQPYQFLNLPPTPGNIVHSSDEFANPPNTDSYEQFQTFDAYNQFNGTSFAPSSTTPQSQPSVAIKNAPGEVPVDANTDAHSNADTRQGSNSDDDENMTPAQSRRKAQNRAAQRAFRERKEQHVKNLEQEVAALKQTTTSVTAENERLKLNLQKMATENEILKATSQHHQQQQHRYNSQSPSPLPETGPMRYSPKDFYAEVLHAHENKTPSHRIVTDEKGGRLLAAGATWDFIIQHPLFQQGVVDMASVSEKLKSVAKCDGQGPVFDETTVIQAIEQSVVSGSDELL